MSSVIVAAGVVVAGASTASAATVSAHEITANWADTPAPVDAPYGATRTAEFHVNTNDANDPHANDPVDNVRATLTVTNGVFVSIPAVCKTTGVTPPSAISNNGTQLLCNLGTIKEGTASVIQAPVKANGAVGTDLSVSGTVTSDSAAAPAGPAATPKLPITGTHGMDLVISAPNQNFQQVLAPSRSGGNRQTIIVDYGLSLTTGSIPGPSSYTFDLDVSPTVTGQVTNLQWEGCAAVGDTAQATGIPYSDAAHPANRTNNPPCTISGSGTHYTVTLTGLDYSLQHVPTSDSLGNAIPSVTSFVAAGVLTFSFTPAITQSTGVDFVATPTPFTFTDGVTQPETDTTNDTTDTTLVLPGSFANQWVPLGPGVGRTAWDAQYFAAPGAAEGVTFPIPGAGTSTSPGTFSNSQLPASSGGDSTAWSTYTGPGGADLAGECTMQSNPADFVYTQVTFYQENGASPTNMTTAHIWYRTDAINTKTETCGEPVGVPGSPWTAATLPASCATHTTYISPVYSDNDCLVNLPPGVTAVKMTWNPAVDSAQHHALNAWGYIPSTAPVGSDSWTIGAFNASYDVNTAFGGGWPNLNNYVNISDNNTVYATIPGCTYAAPNCNTNGQRDAMRIQGANGVITKSTPDTTAAPGVPVTYNLTAEADISVATPPTQTFPVVDTLPAGMTYVDGSGTPTPVVTTNGGGQQVLTWTFTDVPANTPQPISYQAETAPDSSIAPGTVLTNWVEIDVPGDNRAVSARQASASVTVPDNGATSLAKAAEDNVLSFYGDSSAWNLTVNSQDPVNNPFTDTIDILPYTGDGRGTDIDGSYTVTGVTAEAGATVYYTDADPSTLSNDPRDSSNGGTPGTVGGTAGWSTTMPANPTAVRVIGSALAPGASQQVRIAFDTPAGSSCTDPADSDNKPGQKLVNTADSIAGHTALPMLSSATTTIGDCYAMDMKKYVLDKGGDDTSTPGDPASDWHDANSAADYPVYLVGDTVEYAIVVTNKGTGTLTDIAVSDPLATGCDTSIATLAAGASSVVKCSLTATAGTTVNTASASTTPPDGPSLKPGDPAGVNVPEPFVVQKVSDPASGGAVDAGDPVTYTITVTQPGTSVVGYPNPSLTDDLSKVLDDGDYAGDVATAYSAGTGPDAVVDTDAATLTWGSDFLAPGQVVTIAYTINTLNPVTGDMNLTNPVTTPPGQSNCGSPTEDPRCTTDLKVWSLHVEKSADVATAKPGDTVTYTITAHNNGTAEFDSDHPARLSDPLGAVLDDAVIDEASITADVGVATYDTETRTLSWTSDPDALAVDATARITYTVTVNHPGAGDLELRNQVIGGQCAADSTDPDCQADVLVQTYQVAKTADKDVTNPGDVVTYTVVVTNTGKVAYTEDAPASFTDNLSEVLDDGSMPANITGGATYDDATGTLSWSGPLDVDATATITYQVTVNRPNTGDNMLHNVVGTPPEANCAPGLTDPACVVDVPVRSFHVVKTADAPTRKPGQAVTYTIVVHNTGAAAYTTDDPASYTDDLSAVLDDATIDEDAITGGATYDADSKTLSWAGALAVDESKTVTYTVTVNAPDTGDMSLDNTVVTPPGQANCDADSTDPDCAATVLVQTFHVTKKADTAEVVPGEKITYTITVANTGKVDYTTDDPASFTDDLTEVLDDAVYNGDADSGATYAEPVLSWSGELPVGGEVVVTYTVTVDNPITGDKHLLNAVVTPPGEANCDANSSDPDCLVQLPGRQLHVAKSVDTTVTRPGGVVGYTIVVTNTGAAPFTEAKPAGYTDDLTDVLDDATYNGDVTGGAVYMAPNLVWSGPLDVGKSVTIHYTVTVNNPDTGNMWLNNTVTTPGEVGANCGTGSTDPDCRTSTPVQVLKVVKTADTAQAKPGAIINYTVTVSNVGTADYTDAGPATFTDDMTDVIDDATYNNDATGGATYQAPILSWSDALAVGDSATITYSVTVNSSKTGNGSLLNVVSTPYVLAANCGPASSDPRCRTTAPVSFPPPANNGGGGQLPNTGVDTQTPLVLAAWLFVIGGLLLWVGYRRRRRIA